MRSAWWIRGTAVREIVIWALTFSNWLQWWPEGKNSWRWCESTTKLLPSCIHFKATICSFSTLEFILSQSFFTTHWLATGENNTPVIDTAPPGWPGVGLCNFGCVPSTIPWEPASFYSNTLHTKINTSCLTSLREIKRKSSRARDQTGSFWQKGAGQATSVV